MLKKTLQTAVMILKVESPDQLPSESHLKLVMTLRTVLGVVKRVKQSRVLTSSKLTHEPGQYLTSGSQW